MSIQNFQLTQTNILAYIGMGLGESASAPSLYTFSERECSDAQFLAALKAATISGVALMAARFPTPSDEFSWHWMTYSTEPSGLGQGKIATATTYLKGRNFAQWAAEHDRELGFGTRMPWIDEESPLAPTLLFHAKTKLAGEVGGIVIPLGMPLQPVLAEFATRY